MDNEHYNRKYKKIYGIGAKSYDETRFGTTKKLFSKRIKNDNIYDILVRKNIISEDVKIIDLATGTGRIAHELVKKGFSHVYSADITAEMLMENKQNLDLKYHDKVSWLLVDIKNIPFKDSSFDVATVGSFFYLIPQNQYNNYLQDIYRVLKSEGILICEISNALHLINPKSFVSIMHHKYLKRKMVKSFIYPWNIKKLFECFDLDEIIGVGYPLLSKNYDFHWRLSYLLGHSIITKFIGGMYILVFKKRS